MLTNTAGNNNLIILDNAEHAKLRDETLSSLNGNHVIITTRNSDVFSSHQVKLPLFSLAETKELALKLYEKNFTEEQNAYEFLMNIVDSDVLKLRKILSETANSCITLADKIPSSLSSSINRSLPGILREDNDKELASCNLQDYQVLSKKYWSNSRYDIFCAFALDFLAYFDKKGQKYIDVKNKIKEIVQKDISQKVSVDSFTL